MKILLITQFFLINDLVEFLIYFVNLFKGLESTNLDYSVITPPSIRIYILKN